VEQLYPGVGLIETMWVRQNDGELTGRLLEDWSISADGLTWTLNLRKNVPWHQGFGEWDAEDLVFNVMEGGREGSIAAAGKTATLLFSHADGGYDIVDDHTVDVNTGVVRTDFQGGFILHVSAFMSFYSKKVFDQLGETEGEKTAVGTGPFEFAEQSADEFLRLSAVEDHWRKTPNFAELMVWHMPDEDTRLANFLTGDLDTMNMNIQNKPRLEEDPEVRFLIFPNKLSRIFLYGQYYPIPGREPRPGWLRHLEDPTVTPYVSTDPDLDSAAWRRALNLRQAMNHAIDRESLANDLFAGEARPGAHYGFEGGGVAYEKLHNPNVAAKLPAPEFGMNYTQPIDLRPLGWDYDPDLARQLLVDGGYPDGFRTTICLCSGGAGAPQNVMAEAVASMWDEVGIETDLERLPYSAIGGDQFARSAIHRHLPSGGGGTTFEPIRAWQLSWAYDGGWNGGFEHEWVEEAMLVVPTIIDAELRWEKQRQIAKFDFEQVVIIPLILLNEVIPIGPKLEVWEILGAQLNSFELALPR
jgi:ABC-type transport system substrate-binding protein